MHLKIRRTGHQPLALKGCSNPSFVSKAEIATSKRFVQQRQAKVYLIVGKLSGLFQELVYLLGICVQRSPRKLPSALYLNVETVTWPKVFEKFKTDQTLS